MANGWPKDTHPKAIERATAVRNMSFDEAKLSLRAAKRELDLRGDPRVRSDPVAMELIEIIVNDKKKGAVTVRDALETLQMFVGLYHEADPLMKEVEAVGLVGRRPLLMKFAQKWKPVFPQREVFADDLLSTYCQLPMMIGVDLKMGLQTTHEKWGTLTADEKKKFVWDIYDSNKGYPKTARSAPEWQPPRLLDVQKILIRWLNSFANDSVFSGMSLTTTVQVRKQLESYSIEIEIEKNYVIFWFNVIKVINDGCGLSWSKQAVGAAIRQNVPKMTTAFFGLIGEKDIRTFAEKFDEVWDKIL